MMPPHMFFRSSFCNGNNCVEVSASGTGSVLLRDSKNTTREPYTFTMDEWRAFVIGVKAGEFDLE
jgi:hypothetical protein